MNNEKDFPGNQDQTPQGKRTAFAFYYYWDLEETYLEPEPVFIDAEDVEQAKEIFREDYPEYKIFKIVF